MNRLLVIGALLISFVLGAMVVYFDMGPSEAVKKAVHAGGARLGLSPRPALDPRFNFKIRVEAEQVEIRIDVFLDGREDSIDNRAFVAGDEAPSREER